MPLEVDPVYQTLTMVKILREQGSTLTAMELCEKILEKDPAHEGVRKILEELKGEARASFERFRPSGISTESSQETFEADSPAPSLPASPLASPPVSPRLQKLETLLNRVQEYRRVHG